MEILAVVVAPTALIAPLLVALLAKATTRILAQVRAHSVLKTVILAQTLHLVFNAQTALA
jgi:hypothetical protein